ncbi:MAG: methyltransferase domain-containing protein [Chloroflexi bacterium]|nr:methyltransferase domain-containing protein [Chloroflexota bacterium]
MRDYKLEISRVVRSKEKARASYDRLSRWYDLLSGRFERRYRDAGLRMLDARKGEVVLEIGFGTGNCILALANAVGAEGKVCGIDISPGMCSVAETKLRKAGLSDRVNLQCGDAARLPFESGLFDAILMSFTLELFDTPEIPVVLDECRRVLKSGGRICVVAMSRGGKQGPILRLYEWFHKKLPSYVDCRPIFAEKMMDDAGFHIRNVVSMNMWGLPVEIVLAQKQT